MANPTHARSPRWECSLLRAARIVVLAAITVFLPACGSKGGDDSPGMPAAAAPLIIESEDARAVSAAVNGAGGIVSATASNGTTYTLAIPPGALAGQETITIVPVTAVGNLPLRGGLIAAVRFAPDGLELFKPATLTVDLAGQPATAGLVGFGFQDNGEGFHLDLVDVHGTRLVFSVTHFSGVGTAIALTGDLQQILAQPLNKPEFQALNQIADLFAQGSSDLQAYRLVLRDWYFASQLLQIPSMEELGVKRALMAASTGIDLSTGEDDVDEVALRRALRGYLSWLRTIDLVSKRLNVDFAGQVLQGLVAEAAGLAEIDLSGAVSRANKRCRGEHSAGRLDEGLRHADAAIFWQAVAEAFGLATITAHLDLGSVLAGLCIRVEIADVTFPAAIQPGQTATLSFRAPVVLQATAPPVPYTRPVAVTITASGVAAPVPGGHTDASSHFTVSVQQSGASNLVLDVDACLDEPAFPRLSKVCGGTVIQRGVDSTPPTVVSTIPSNGATGVGITAVPTISFSEPMDPATITGVVFTLIDSTNGGTVTATVNVNGAIATLTPSSNLTPSTLYTATVTTVAMDLAGNRLTADHTWTFTTGTGSPPTILGGYDGTQTDEVIGSPANSGGLSRWSIIGSLQTNSFVLQRKLNLGGGAEGCTASTCTPEFSLIGGTINVTGTGMLTGSVGGGQLHFEYIRPCPENGEGAMCRITFDGTHVVVQLSPTSLDFGTVTVGAASSPQSVTVSNPGPLPVGVTLSVSVPSGFLSTYTLQDSTCVSTSPFFGSFFLASSASFGVDAGSACSFTVQFTPPNHDPQPGTVSGGTFNGEGVVQGSPVTLTGVGN